MARFSFRRFLRRLRGEKGGPKPQGTSTGTPSATPFVSTDVLTTQESAGNGSSLTSPVTVQSLWNRAYEALAKEDENLTEKYNDLLMRQTHLFGLTSDGPPIVPADKASSDSAIQFDRSQLLELCERGLAQMEEKKIVLKIGNLKLAPKERIASAVELVLKIKDLISEAIMASPEASIAWAGVCLALPLLTGPKTADEANRDGFTYVTMRMRYYTELESLVRPLEQDTNAANALTQVYNSIERLYQSMLEFQILTALRFFNTPLKRYGRDVFASEDWKKKRENIESLEAIVDKNLGQINEFVSLEKLEPLKTASTASVDALGELVSLSTNHLRVAEALLDETAESRNILEKQLSFQRNEFELRLTKEERQCLQVFRLTSSQKDVSYEWYKDRVQHRLENTCQWFLNHKKFAEWLAQDSGMLLVSADPGCGKSVLAKHLIDNVLQGAIVCYFFFKDKEQNTVRQALCALLHQIFSHDTSLIKDHALPEFRKDGDGLVNTTTSLWKIFDSVVQDSRSGNVVTVLDALDECAETEFEDLVVHLKPRFRGERPQGQKLKLLMTSRPYQQITYGFQDLFNDIPNVHIPGEEHSEAISQEINHVIEHRVKSLGLSRDLTAHLAHRLFEITHRTYLWVHLVLENLKKGGFRKTREGLNEKVKELPKNVHEAYQQILKKCEDHDQPQARTALSIILAAERPLTVSEMNIAMNVQREHEAFSHLDLESDENFKSNLRSWCGLFVSIYHEKVYFLHQTAREFLLADTSQSLGPQSVPSWWESISVHQSHAVLAEKCVLYLSLYNYMRADDATSNDTFLDYAAAYWGLHFREAAIADDDFSFPIAQDICRPDSVSYSMWFNIFWHEEAFGNPSKLGLASYMGHVTIVERILATEKVDLSSRECGPNQTPLFWAALGGHEAVVKVLLAAGNVNINSVHNGVTPLCIAIIRGHEAVVKQLLTDKNVDLDLNSPFPAPLYWALVCRHKAIPDLIITRLGPEAITRIRSSMKSM